MGWFVVECSNDPGRIARDDSIRWHILRHNAAGANDRPFANGDSAEQGGTRTNRCAAFD
jgi:hypothetical protein